MTKLKRSASLLLVVLVVGCSDPDLKKVSVALTDVGYSIIALQTAVIEAEKAGLMTTENTRSVIQLCVKVRVAGEQAVNVTRNLSQLDAPSRTQILNILAPVIGAVGNLAQSGALGIKNPDTQQKVQAILSAIQVSLNTAQLVLSVGGK